MPPVLTGDEIYDSLMQTIEPELLIAVMPTLEEKYKHETPEQAKERAARYEKAFKEYDRKFGEYKENWIGQWNLYRHHVLHGAEKKSRTKESGGLRALEDAITEA